MTGTGETYGERHRSKVQGCGLIRPVTKVYISIVYIYGICVLPFPLVSLCQSQGEPMDGSHSFWPECDGQR